MKIVMTLFFTLVFTTGCTISDDYAVAFSGCIDHFEEVNSRLEKDVRMEVTVRGIESFDYCARLSRKMVRIYRRMGYSDHVAVNQALSKQ